MYRNFIATLATGLSRPTTLIDYYYLQWMQKQSKSKIIKVKERNLKKILHYAYENTEYYNNTLHPYREIWSENNFNWEAFSEIPFLTKEIIRKNSEHLISKNVHKYKTYVQKSGGSTGIPTQHIHEKNLRVFDQSNNMLFKSWGNCSIGDKVLIISAQELENYSSPESNFLKVSNYIFNKNYINLFNFSLDKVEQIVNYINSEKPKIIQLYANAAYQIAQVIKSKGYRITAPPSMLMCIAGTIQKDKISLVEEAFAAPMFSRYGSRETGDMMGFCRDRVYHEIPNTHHIEVINNPNYHLSRNIGDISVTTLKNRAMPIIRYLIGDVGVIDDSVCNCGCNFNIISNIEGRTGDVIVNKSGKMFMPEVFVHLIGVIAADEKNLIYKFQIIQKTLELIVLKLVLLDNAKLDSKKEENIIKMIKAVYIDPLNVEICYEQDIPNLKNGKFAYVTTLINNE